MKILSIIFSLIKITLIRRIYTLYLNENVKSPKIYTVNQLFTTYIHDKGVKLTKKFIDDEKNFLL